MRTGWRKVRLRQPDDAPFDLLTVLPEADYDRPVDRQVTILGNSKDRDIPAHLIILRKPPEATDQERKRLRRTASRKCRKLNPASLIAAEYMLLLISFPEDQFDAASIAALYRVRWQIELAFKRLKSLIHIDRLPTKNPALARTWLLSHLILALLIERQSEEFMTHSPQEESSKQRYPSRWRLHKLIIQAFISAIQGAWDLTRITANPCRFWQSICEPPRKRKIQRIPQRNALS
ncbi:Transposase DDE domain protein [Pseudovibrio sp. WM33]|nr:Transposase DDE domain protein [Pseudovibrio sp. WM33]